MLKIPPKRRNARLPPTPAVAAARSFAARVRIGLAGLGAVLLAAAPALHPEPAAAAAGLAVLALTGLIHGTQRHDRWLRVEEPLACGAGLLLVTLGPGRVTVLTLIWLVAVAAGVVARGGRVGGLGRALVVLVLLSPAARHGIGVDTIGLFGAGCGLLLTAGRISLETSELLRDPLTGALLRGAFDAQVDRAAAAAAAHRPIGLVMVDLDDFGLVNKRHGHRAGDDLLVAAVRALDGCLRSGDFVGRVGGDEFAVLTAGERPEVVADRIVGAMGRAGIAASAGVAVCPRDGRDGRALMAAADVGLRLAKRDGKNRVTVYAGPQMAAPGEDGAAQVLARLCAGDGVHMALQPIVDLRTGTVYAYEALARFAVRRSEAGPTYWFTVADGLGLRRALELACLRKAVALLERVPAPARLTVNLSAEMIDDPQVAELVENTPGAQRLVLELTEHRSVPAHHQVDVALRRLRSRGVQIAVDDVGAGHEALGQLAVVRPDYIKLDRRFVRGMGQAPDRAQFVKSLTGYVRETQCSVIAGGVETLGDLGSVRDASIDLVQGFLLGRPRSDWDTDDQADLAARAVATG